MTETIESQIAKIRESAMIAGVDLLSIEVAYYSPDIINADGLLIVDMPSSIDGYYVHFERDDYSRWNIKILPSVFNQDNAIAIMQIAEMFRHP